MIHICPEMYFHIKILFIINFIAYFIYLDGIECFQQEVGGFMIQKIHHLRSQVSNSRQNGQPLFGTWFSNCKHAPIEICVMIISDIPCVNPI